MSCTINYNTDGKISRVNNPDGTESMLFNQLAKIPHMDTLEQALESFKNVYTEKFNKAKPTADVTLEIIDFEGYDDSEIDAYEASEKAEEIANNNGLNILRGKELKMVALDSDGNVIGGVWTEVDDNKFSFDIAVDQIAQGKGVGEKLVNEAINEFNSQSDAEEELEYSIDVTNPIMEKLLTKYGFVVSDTSVPGHTIMTHPTNNPKLKTKEQELQYVSDQGNTFNTFKDALNDSKGGDIQVGIETFEGFKPLHVISSNTNKNDKGGLVNYLIKNNIIAGEKVIENGVSYLKAEGYDQAKQVVNEIVAKESLVNAKVHKDGRIELAEETKSTPSEYNQKMYSAVKDAQARVFGSKKPTLSEDALKERLLDFLKSIGVTVTTIEEYNKKFAQKNGGADPSAEALADFANQIVAFREGTGDINTLAEETAHFIVEGWNEEEIEDLLRNIHKTDSYQQHAETYRAIYTNENPNMSAEEVEKLVRKEILGKELANALVTKFSTEGKTETQVSIMNRLYDLLLQFFNKITLQGNYKDKLDDLTTKVEDLLISKDVNRYINSDNYSHRKFRMYSVSQASNPQKALVKVLQEQERILKQLGRGSSEQVKQLEELLMAEMEKSTVRELTSLAKRQTRYIKEAITEANRRGTTLSNEENIVYQNLKNMISPALASLKVTIDKNPEYSAEVADIKTVQQDIADAVGLVKNSENDLLESLVDKLVKRHKLDVKVDAQGNLVEDLEAREYLMEAIKTAQKDTNSMYSYFGQITQANDPMLNMLGVIIGDVYQDTAEEFSERAKEFQRAMRDMGFEEKDISQFLQEDGYIASKWNFTEFEEFRKYAQAQVYLNNLDIIIADLQGRKAKGESVAKELAEHEANKAKTQDQFLADFKSMPWISNGDLRQDTITDSQKLINTGSETFLSEAYLKEQEDKLDRLGISQMTRTKLKGFSNARAMVKKTMRRSKNGVPIMTLQNKHDLDFINIERRTASSIYDISGKLKDGITVHDTAVAGSVQISENEFITLRPGAPNEATISFEMNKLTRDFINEKNASGAATSDKLDKTTHALWWQDLADMEADPEVTREDIISWFNLNTSVGFSKAFFEENENIDIFEEFENDDAVKDKIVAYKEALRSRRAVINQFRDPNNAVNTLAEDMPESVKNDILSKSEDIDRMSSEIFMYIKGKNKRKADNLEEEVVRASTGANEAFHGAIEDLGLTSFQQKLDFTLKHMTASNRKRVQEFADAVKLGLNTDKFSGYPASEEGVLQFAQTKLLPYYASYAPVGLQEFYNKIRNTSEKVSDLIEDLNEDPNVRLSVSYDYLDTTNTDILNKDRDADFKGGYAQPSLNKKPTVFGKTFDFKNKDWSKIEGNANLKKLYDAYIEFQAQSLKDNDYENHNVYIAPQVPKTKVEQARSLATGERGETIKEWWKGLANYRVGDIAEGETDAEGTALHSAGIRVIPRYFMHKLEDQSNVSKDLFYSSMMMAQQATLRKNRVKYYSQMASVMDAIHSDGRYADIGKQAEATNTYKMAKSYIDNAFYGVEDTARLRVNLPILGQKDLTKTLKTIHRWKQNLSLALNPIVPMTSYITAASGMFGERIIGQYVDADSMNKAHAAFNKNIFGGMKEGLSAYSENDTTSMMEHFGLIDASNRYENSAYSKMERFFGKSMYGLHQMADYPIKANVLYASMFGSRIYNERLLDYNEFKKIGTGQGKSKADIKTEWKNLKSLYDYAKVENGKFSYDPILYTDLKMSEEDFRNIEKGIISKAKTLASRVDGAIRPEERTFAQRHYALRYTMTHKGWLSIAVSSRFKGNHLNLQTGEREEGSYITLAHFLSQGINNVYGGIRTGNFTDFKNMWKNASDTEKVNMQRIAKELAILGGIYALGLIFAGFSDDDEEDFSKQYMAYLFERVTNETISAQAGVVKEVYASIKEPVVGLSQMLEIPKAYKVISGDEEVTRGRYAGMTERERWIVKNIVGLKPAYDLSSAKNLKSQRDSYNFFNHGNDDWNPFAYIITKEEYLEDED